MSVRVTPKGSAAPLAISLWCALPLRSALSRPSALSRRFSVPLLLVVVMMLVGSAAVAAPVRASSDSAPSDVAVGTGQADLLDDPDLGMGPGTVRTPTRDVEAILKKHDDGSAPVRTKPGVKDRDAAASRSRREGTLALPFDFVRDGYRWNDLPVPHRPYVSGKIQPKSTHLPLDEEGVRMFEHEGKLWNHPIAQAQFGLAALEAYRLTDDPFYLERARKQAQRIIDTRVESSGAWFYPFPFDYDLHQKKDKWPMRAPWYGGMAQGQALSFFVRMYDVTQEAQWREAADYTFQSFFNLPSSSKPWVVHDDQWGYLWFEEYAKLPVSESDWTYNGHMFAVFGMWDYYRISRNPEALAMYDGGISTVRRYAETVTRNPNWISDYCLTHHVMSDRYHRIHSEQYVYLWLMTKQPRFVRLAELFRDDYPVAAVGSRFVEMAKGTHTAYEFDADGKAVGSKSITLTRASGAPADLRQRIKGRGIYYHITSGMLAGYWIAESASKGVLMSGPAGALNHHAGRTAYFEGGRRYVAHRYDGYGRVTATKSMTFNRESSAAFVSTGYIKGVRHALFGSGTFDGYWVPMTYLRVP